jgi:HK97 family phage portal protein
MLTKLKHFFFEHKRSAAAPIISLHSAGHAVWTPRNYASLAKEGFAGNPIGYRAIRMISEAAASIPLLAYTGETEAMEHPALKLLGRPNPGQPGREFFEMLYGFLLVAGNAYVEKVEIDGNLRELFALRPDRMKAIASANGWPEGFEYSVGGQSVRFPREHILHVKLFNPLNDHYGMSPLEAAQRPIDTHNAAAAWNKAMLDNSARPSGALVYAAADGHLTTDQFERLKRELETSYQGAANAGRPMVLEGGLDWKEMGFSPKEMEFIEAKNAAAREIALAFGVPPMLLGIPGDNTFANYAEANRSFWRQTIVPLAGRVAEALSGFLSVEFEGLRLVHDLDQVEALSLDRDALWSRVDKASFLTGDEKRAAVGYGPLGANSEWRRGSVPYSPFATRLNSQGQSSNANPPGEKPAGAAVIGLLRHGCVRGLCQPVRRARCRRRCDAAGSLCAIAERRAHCAHAVPARSGGTRRHLARDA